MFNFNIHEHAPAVEALAIHLDGEAVLVFDPEQPPQRNEGGDVDDEEQDNFQINQPVIQLKDTTLMGFFKLCERDPTARDILYADVPKYYRWVKNAWTPRKTKEQALGRVYPVSPREEELFCLRLLLFTKKGPTSFEALKTFEGVICPTFKEAARRYGLLEDDRQYDNALEEAKMSDTAFKIRQLFVTIVTACNPLDPLRLWTNFKDVMAEDIQRKKELKRQRYIIVKL